MEHYVYRPVRFYITVFALTWGFWIAALILQDTPMLYVFMILERPYSHLNNDFTYPPEGDFL